MATPARPQMAFPKPGPALKWVLGIMFATWLTISLSMNWAGVSSLPIDLLSATPGDVLGGQLWRPLTALFVHDPSSLSHILLSLFMVYMFGSSLEQSWGSKKFVRFLLISGALAYLIQALVALVLPDSFLGTLVGPYCFGSSPMVEACIIAWAISFRGRTVYLFFALPVTTVQLIFFTVGINVLLLVTRSVPPSGFVALFAGMGAGWLLGGKPSPLRRWYLEFRQGQLQREVETERKQRKKRVKGSGLRVIHGGQDDEPPPKDMLN